MRWVVEPGSLAGLTLHTLAIPSPGAVPDAWRTQCLDTPRTGSFVHLHAGIDAVGLPADLECHHLVVLNDWADTEASFLASAVVIVMEGSTVRESCSLLRPGLQLCQLPPPSAPPPAQPHCHRPAKQAPQNVVNISIPTVFDASLAPSGKHLIHAYTGKCGCCASSAEAREGRAVGRACLPECLPALPTAAAANHPPSSFPIHCPPMQPAMSLMSFGRGSVPGLLSMLP